MVRKAQTSGFFYRSNARMCVYCLVSMVRLLIECIFFFEGELEAGEDREKTSKSVSISIKPINQPTKNTQLVDVMKGNAKMKTTQRF